MKLACRFCGELKEYPFSYKTGQGVSYKKAYERAVEEVTKECECEGDERDGI